MDVNSFVIGYTKGKQSASGGGGGGSGGGVELNIAYGDTAPEDTTKLWVKTGEPSGVSIVPTSPIGEATYTIETLTTTLPVKAYGIASAVVGTKVYLFGGSTGKYLDTINVFDIETNTITTLTTTLPAVASDIASAVVGTKVYLFGGFNSSNNGQTFNTINVFDTETNTITTLTTTLPTAASSIASAVVGTKVYLFGGYIGDNYGGGALDTINVFDIETNTITTLTTTLPTAASSIASAVVGTKVYLFGGSKKDTINVFDTETNTIETLTTTLPAGASKIASAVVGTKVYLFGGSASTYLDTINVFDIETNTIETLTTTLPVKAYSIASAVVGTKVYLFGGFTNLTQDTIYVFNIPVVSFFLEANNLLICASLVINLFSLLPNMVIGIADVYIGNKDNYSEKVEAALYKDDVWTTI